MSASVCGHDAATAGTGWRRFGLNCLAKLERLPNAQAGCVEERSLAKVLGNDSLARHWIRIKRAQGRDNHARFVQVGSKRRALGKESVAIRIVAGRDIKRRAGIGDNKGINAKARTSLRVRAPEKPMPSVVSSPGPLSTEVIRVKRRTTGSVVADAVLT